MRQLKQKTRCNRRLKSDLQNHFVQNCLKKVSLLYTQDILHIFLVIVIYNVLEYF